MAESTRRNQVYYDHIVFAWLNSNPDSNDIDCLLCGESQTNLRSLKTLVRRPGLELGNITFVNDQGVNSTLSDDQVRELKAVVSFLIITRTGMDQQYPPDIAISPQPQEMTSCHSLQTMMT